MAQASLKPGSAELRRVGAGGDRIEHIGQKTVGYGTRDGANVMALEATLGGQLGGERTGGSVHGL